MKGPRIGLSTLTIFPDAVIAVDKNGLITFANGLAESLFGYDPGELAGLSLDVLIPERFADIHRRHVASFLSAPRMRPMGAGLELYGRRKDASEFPAEINLSPVADEDQPLVLCVIRDVGARRDVESQLRLQSAALESSANSIVITDCTGKITWANPAFSRLTGYTLPEVQNQNPRILRSGVHDERFYKQLWDTILAGEIWHGEIVNRRKDGSLYTEEQTIAPVRDANNQITHFIAIKQDVTERKTAEEALEKQRVYLTALHEVTLGLLARRELRELLRDMVERACHLVGAAGGFLFMMDPVRNELKPVVSTGALAGGVLRSMKGGAGLAGRVWRSGSPLVIEDYDSWDGRCAEITPGLARAVVGVPLKNKSDVIGVLGLAYDRQSLKNFLDDEVRLLMRFAQFAALTVDNTQLYEATQELAVRDPLTSVYNRRHLFDLARLEFERVRRYSQKLSAVMLDIDHFKRLNDSWGHRAGDTVLRSVADCCRSHLREVDTPARYGGDEFVILLPYADLEQAVQVANRIRRVVAETPIRTEQAELNVTVSAGVVQVDQVTLNLETLLERADRALYVAKRLGRNRVEWWKPEFAMQGDSPDAAR